MTIAPQLRATSGNAATAEPGAVAQGEGTP